MNDRQILALYWARDEHAVDETAAKYGRYCHAIAYHILGDEADAEESVNDTYLDAWNSIPPHRPARLATFLGKITRRIAVDRFRRRTAQKRGGGQTEAVLSELQDCIPDHRSVEQEIDRRQLQHIINAFVKALPDTQRRVFLCRYWYMESVEEIAARFGFSQSKVKSMLYRTREKLRARLTKEGFS